jgi:segregation and condensation protein A
MDTSATYQVRLEVFEGPLDLLLFLIRKKKIDINDIPMAIITREYLEYLDLKERINLDREAEFLLIASLLIYIKSQMLLPREKGLEEEGEDPRQVLVDQLLDYKKIKAASLLLRKKEENELRKWKRTGLPSLFPEEEADFIEVSLFDLAESFFSLLRREEKKRTRTIKRKEFSLEEKMKEIVAVLKENLFLDFLDYFSQKESLEEAFISFFSLLELVKSRIVIAIQKGPFQPIEVRLLQESNLKRN